MQSMTATEVCDRLGDRFRLLVGPRRGLERHQTLRHDLSYLGLVLNHVSQHFATIGAIGTGCDPGKWLPQANWPGHPMKRSACAGTCNK